MAARIVLFGATGYTGRLTAEAMVERGLRPVLAARNKGKLDALAGELAADGIETMTADVTVTTPARLVFTPSFPIPAGTPLHLTGTTVPNSGDLYLQNAPTGQSRQDSCYRCGDGGQGRNTTGDAKKPKLAPRAPMAP